MPTRLSDRSVSFHAFARTDVARMISARATRLGSVCGFFLQRDRVDSVVGQRGFRAFEFTGAGIRAEAHAIPGLAVDRHRSDLRNES